MTFITRLLVKTFQNAPADFLQSWILRPRSPVLQEKAHTELTVSKLTPPVLGLESESCNQGERSFFAFKVRLRVIH